MDAEASTSSAVLHASDADMTIDYDGGEQPMAAGAGGDAEMGDEGPTLDEAEMRDDDAHHEADATFMTAYEGDPEVLADDDGTLPSSSAPLASFASTSATFQAFSAAPAMSAAPFVSSEPLTTHIEFDSASETLFQPPATSDAAEVPIPIPSEPTLTPAPLVSATLEADAVLVETEAPILAPSVGDGGSAARDLETTDAAGTSAGAGAVETASAGAKLDVVEVTDEAESGDRDAPESTAKIASSAQLEASAPEAGVNLAKVEADASVADALDGSSNHHRPLVDKDPLLSIEVPTLPSTSALRDVPVVFLTHDSTTWSLFHPYRDTASTSGDAEAETDAAGEDLPLLFGAPAQHELYYKPLETVFRVVRVEIDELRDQGDELVIEFDEIGISLSEDNIYSRQVTLFDFDRIHTGCQIPGRLHARIFAQPRFATGFNALAEHIARIASGASDEGEGEEGEQSVTLVAEEGSEGEIRGEEGAEEEEGEGVADDHDGPDSELPRVEEAVDAKAGEEHEAPEGEGEGGDEEFDLDQALAQLDSEDVVAVVEGAQEDLLSEEQRVGDAEAREEGEERGTTADAGPNEEPSEEQTGGVVEAGRGEEAHADEQEEEKIHEDGGEKGVEEVAVAESGESAAAEGPTESTEPTAPEAAEPESANGQDVAESTAAAGSRDDDAPAASNGPDDESNTTGDAPAAGEPAETASQDAVKNAAVESVGANGTSSTAAEETEEPTDVVIDYDEAFDAAPAPATVGENGVEVATEPATTTIAEESAPTSPKRTRKFEHEDGLDGADDQASSEAKRPRLADPVAVSTA